MKANNSNDAHMASCQRHFHTQSNTKKAENFIVVEQLSVSTFILVQQESQAAPVSSFLDSFTRPTVVKVVEVLSLGSIILKDIIHIFTNSTRLLLCMKLLELQIVT